MHYLYRELSAYGFKATPASLYRINTVLQFVINCALARLYKNSCKEQKPGSSFHRWIGGRSLIAGRSRFPTRRRPIGQNALITN